MHICAVYAVMKEKYTIRRATACLKFPTPSFLHHNKTGRIIKCSNPFDAGRTHETNFIDFFMPYGLPFFVFLHTP